jgi:branched-chain amino acid transport system substrate-binding protein
MIHGIKQLRATIFPAFMCVAILGAGISCTKAPTSQNAPEAVKVGVMLPLTGNIAFIGENIRNGMIMAYEGSTSDYKAHVEFVFEDHKNSPMEAVAIYSRFPSAKTMPAVIPAITSVTNAILPLVKESPRVLIGTVLSGSDMPDKSDWLFRYFLSTPDEVNNVVQYLKKNPVKDIGVFYVNDDFGLDAKNVFRANFSGNVLFEEAYDKNASDFKNLVPKSLKASALYVLGYGASYGTFVKQLRVYGYQGVIFCFSSFATPVALKEAGDYGEGVVFTGTVYSSPTGNPLLEEFKTKYQGKFGKAPDHYSVYGYDITNIVLRAITEVHQSGGIADPASVKETILGWGRYSGLLGETVIKPNKDFVFQNIKLFRLGKNGTFIEIEQ